MIAELPVCRWREGKKGTEISMMSGDPTCGSYVTPILIHGYYEDIDIDQEIERFGESSTATEDTIGTIK